MINKILKILKVDSIVPPFKKYYPSKKDMNFLQRLFYGYWRMQWRAGNPVKADTSYIFVYIYEVIREALLDSGRIKINELKEISRNYNDQVGDHISSWILDLKEIKGSYQECLAELKDDYYSNCREIERIMDLKMKCGEEMTGLDVICLVKNVGIRLPKAVQTNIDETINLCDERIKSFQEKRGKTIFRYIKDLSPPLFYYKKEFYLFDGVPLEEWQEKKVERINFLSHYFLVKFAVDTTEEAISTIKSKYGRGSRQFKTPTHLSLRLWEIRIYEPFKNPYQQENSNQCPHPFLILENHWETFRKYLCPSCRNSFMCKCEEDLILRSPKYHQAKFFLRGICPKCRGLDDASFITKGKLMYGSTFYAKYWREINFERYRSFSEENSRLNSSEDIKKESREAENRIREKYGVPLIGEGWVSETSLYKTIKKLLPEYKVIHHGKPDWLGKMHLDVYVPKIGIAFEYQGKQHTESVEYFGGEKAFEKVKERDRKKAELCKKHGVKLFYVHEGEDFSEDTLYEIIKKYI